MSVLVCVSRHWVTTGNIILSTIYQPSPNVCGICSELCSDATPGRWRRDQAQPGTSSCCHGHWTTECNYNNSGLSSRGVPRADDHQLGYTLSNTPSVICNDTGGMPSRGVPAWCNPAAELQQTNREAATVGQQHPRATGCWHSDAKSDRNNSENTTEIHRRSDTGPAGGGTPADRGSASGGEPTVWLGSAARNPQIHQNRTIRSRT